MIADKTGSLAGISRHDYLPFGEEMFAGSGGRTTLQGYSVADGARQKFATYERDNETGLDYAQARYYSSSQGRFTSPDDFLNDTSAVDPASWNLYAYVRSNPLRYTDPNGEKVYVGNVTGADREELLRRANYTYGCESCVSVDSNGFLTVNTTGLSQDVLRATQYLTDAITTNDPSKLFSVQVTNNNPDVAFGDSRRGVTTVQLPGSNSRFTAIRIRLDFADDRWVSGDKAAKAAFLNLVFAHEVAHFYPDYIQDPKDSHQTGPVVDRVNEIQQARGLPLRAEYSARGRSGGDFFVSVEFGRARTDRAGNIQRNGEGIRVERTSQVVRWLKRNVGGKGIN
jgi:RHS repeat-associated protein